MMSPMIIQNINWREVAKFIAVKVPQEEIDKEGLTLVIPRRKKNRTRNITINYLMNKKNDQK